MNSAGIHALNQLTLPKLEEGRGGQASVREKGAKQPKEPENLSSQIGFDIITCF